MIPVTIQKTIEIAAGAALVWPYVGTEAGLRQWWGLDISLEAKLHGRCEEHSIIQDKARCFLGEVTVYEPPHQLALLLYNTDEQEGWPAWMTVSITLDEQNGRTQVTLVHQTFGLLPTDTAVNRQPVPSSAISGPQARRAGQPPQNSLSIAPATVVPLTEFYPASPIPSPTEESEKTWHTQYDSTWHDRLQALLQRVMLAG